MEELSVMACTYIFWLSLKTMTGYTSNSKKCFSSEILGRNEDEKCRFSKQEKSGKAKRGHKPDKRNKEAIVRKYLLR